MFPEVVGPDSSKDHQKPCSEDSKTGTPNNFFGNHCVRRCGLSDPDFSPQALSIRFMQWALAIKNMSTRGSSESQVRGFGARSWSFERDPRVKEGCGSKQGMSGVSPGMLSGQRVLRLRIVVLPESSLPISLN